MRTGRPLAASVRHQHGYTYLLVLFLVATLGLGAAQTGVVWEQAAAREREVELLYRGADIARAIGRYRAASPVGSPAWPQSLDDLVEDRRQPMPVRHLRRVWHDPFTGAVDWVLLRAGGGIVGLHSRSEAAPIRIHELPPELSPTAAQARSHAEWVFRPVLQADASAAEGAAP
ncbi:general secretion pathway protein [Azoarcus sp. DD4]|nr:general secretion pathway protein [Azoarcus sp. DD4]